MSIVSFKVDLESVDGTTTKMTAGNHTAIFDVAKEEGGNDKGATPGAYVAGSLGACKIITAEMLAKKMRIELKSIKIEVEADYDPESASGKNPDIPKGLQAFRTKYIIESDNSEKEIEKFIQTVEDNCPIRFTLLEPAKESYKIELK